MSRHRWFLTKWPITISSIAEKLRENTFQDGKSEGFVLDRIRKEYLEARFIERIEYDTIVTDPFGKEFSLKQLNFIQSKFVISIQQPGLEIIDAPKSVTNLITYLSELNNFSLSLDSITVDVLKWTHLLQNELKTDIEIESVQIGKLVLAKDILAKVLIKGSGDVRNSCLEMTQNKSFVIEKVQIKLKDSHSSKILLTNTAVAHINSAQNTEIHIALRDSLAKTKLTNSNLI